MGIFISSTDVSATQLRVQFNEFNIASPYDETTTVIRNWNPESTNLPHLDLTEVVPPSLIGLVKRGNQTKSSAESSTSSLQVSDSGEGTILNLNGIGSQKGGRSLLGLTISLLASIIWFWLQRISAPKDVERTLFQFRFLFGKWLWPGILLRSSFWQTVPAVSGVDIFNYHGLIC